MVLIRVKLSTPSPPTEHELPYLCDQHFNLQPWHVCVPQDKEVYQLGFQVLSTPNNGQWSYTHIMRTDVDRFRNATAVGFED